MAGELSAQRRQMWDVVLQMFGSFDAPLAHLAGPDAPIPPMDDVTPEPVETAMGEATDLVDLATMAGARLTSVVLRGVGDVDVRAIDVVKPAARPVRPPKAAATKHAGMAPPSTARRWGFTRDLIAVGPYRTRAAIRSAIRRGVLVEGIHCRRHGGKWLFDLHRILAGEEPKR